MIDYGFAFVNKDGTRIIPLQDNSQLDIEEIRKEYLGNNSRTRK